MKINNILFKNIVINYFKFLIKTTSIDVLRWPSELNQYQIRIIIYWSTEFFFHSLGLKRKFFNLDKNYDVYKFFYQIIHNIIDFDWIYTKLLKKQRSNFLKKIKAILFFLSKLKTNQIFNWFKFKPFKNENGTYNHSECILLSDWNDTYQIVLLCKIGNKYHLDINKHRSIYWNELRNCINVVVIPISLKLVAKNKINTMNLFKVNWSFQNFKQNKKWALNAHYDNWDQYSTTLTSCET
ncbi:hypothetical protein EG856_02105 [Mycoplasmopsis phocirhinis]|uniref:Uncharacterized protein n=1 Tax=Mycoplasmopsis phocirhinis TaxID=142650 RepID=A0A4P6MP87_9BACT|nr:hypothetical protein [Mycoplasmopsis phocirhinis]QBF34700.1 hypothetical protein EG856_02105 [Mycoplasmopsis phocirhinis]